jgi:hypothetical protein
MNSWMLTLTLVILSTGCTAMSLERHALNQIASITDLRYKEVLDNLARLAAAPGALPSFAIVADGTAQINDTGILDSKILWNHMFAAGFASETLGGTATHNPQLTWTLNPVVDEPRLKALQCALQWALYGPPEPGSECAKSLKKFQVDFELAKIPPSWLHVGKCKDVPKDACYVAHCHGTYVWVTLEGLAGLSAFTLVLLDIGTVVYESLELPKPQATVVVGTSSIRLSDLNPPSLTSEGKLFVCQETDESGKPGKVQVVYENGAPWGGHDNKTDVSFTADEIANQLKMLPPIPGSSVTASGITVSTSGVGLSPSLAPRTSQEQTRQLQSQLMLR